jgi:acyl-coenzyme A thioesterase PaaI-like protein
MNPSEMSGQGRVIHLSRTIGVSEGSLRDEEGTLFAHATATCAILRK